MYGEVPQFPIAIVNVHGKIVANMWQHVATYDTLRQNTPACANNVSDSRPLRSPAAKGAPTMTLHVLFTSDAACELIALTPLHYIKLVYITLTYLTSDHIASHYITWPLVVYTWSEALPAGSC